MSRMSAERIRILRKARWMSWGDEAAVVLVALLFLGGVLDKAYLPDGLGRALAFALCGILGIWGAIGWAAGRWDYREMRPTKWVLALLGFMVLWTGMQTIPLPTHITTALSPPWREITEHLNASGIEIPKRLPLAIAPEEARHSWSQMFASFLFFLGISLLASRRSASLGLLLITTIAAVCEGIFGLARFTMSSDLRAHGFIFNPSHHAAFVMTGLPIAWAAVFLWQHRSLNEERHEHRRVRSFVQHPALIVHALLVLTLLGWATGFSRGALLIGLPIVLGWATLEIFRLKRQEHTEGIDWRRWLLLTGIGGLAAAILLFAVILPGFSARFGFSGGSTGVNRSAIWSATAKGIEKSPLFGYGLGGSERVINRYVARPTESNAEEVHNEYLQLGLEMGLPALAIGAIFLLLAGLSWVRSTGPKGFWRRRRVLNRAAAAGALACLAHSLVDFHLRVPLVGFELLTVAALALGNGLARFVAGDAASTE